MRYRYVIKILLGIGILSLSSCDKDRNNPGNDFYPDMVYSQAGETYGSNSVFKDSSNQRMPVEGTKSLHNSTFRFSKLPENRLLAGQTLSSTDKVNLKYIEEGRNLYKVFCFNCHGVKGRGNGFLRLSGKLPVQPQDLNSERLKAASRGDLFHVATAGMGLMGAHGAQISESDRWKIIEYVKVKFHNQAMGDKSLSAATTMETYKEFEKRMEVYYKSKGVGPIKNLKLGAINKSMAAKGKAMFDSKCLSCHKPAKKYIGPAPKDILKRRTPEWVMNMILAPEKMLAEDPIAKALLERYLAPMANQNLTEQEAREVLEYFRTIK